MKQAFDRLQKVRESLKAQYLERDEVVDGMLVGMLAKQHVFLLGPAGTAKSDMTRSLCETMVGQFFQYVLGKFTTPEELYGPPSLTALEQGRYERMTDRTFVTADVAFLDEIFKCSVATLNTMLPCLNERIFFNGPTQVIKMPLQFAVGASNELPESQELGALYDRFLIRFLVNRIQNRDNARRIMVSGACNSFGKISQQDLQDLRKAADALQISEAVMNAILDIRDQIHQGGIYCSDRKWRQSLGVLRAYALLEGHSEVEMDDLSMLRNMMWDRPEQRTQINKIIAKYSNPLGEQILVMLDACREQLDNLDNPQLKTNVVEAHGKVKKAVEMLKKLSAENPTNKRAAEGCVEAQSILTRIVKEKLGLA